MFPRITRFSILAAAILVSFVCSLLLVSSLLFALGVSLSWFQVPLAAAMAAGFGWWIANRYFPEERIRAFGLASGASMIAFFFFVLLNAAIYDSTWDGQTYHTEAIGEFANGWNPFRDVSHTGLFYPTLLSFFPKGPWICAAALYKFTGSFESGKAFHLTLILACWLFSLAALSTFRRMGLQWIIILSLLIAFNPVSLCQMYSYYVDGQLSSLLGITAVLLILIGRRPDRVLMVVLALVVILTINVKLTGALYIAIIGIGYYFWYAIARKRRSTELAAWLLAGGIVGGGFVGFNPYITQFLDKLITTGNPFYPKTNWTEVISLESRFFPSSMGRLGRLLESLFSKSEIVPTPPFKLKVPFTFSRNEFEAFAFPDVRVGGFGPLFGGALLLSLAILALLIWKYRRRLRYTASLLVISVLILISVLSFSEVWWARFAPQMWMIPLMLGMIELLIVRRGRWRWPIYALLMILCLNNLMISYRYTLYNLRETVATMRQLSILRSQGKPIPVTFKYYLRNHNYDYFIATRYRFEREGIPYVEVETLPCAQDRQTQVTGSLALICKIDIARR